MNPSFIHPSLERQHAKQVIPRPLYARAFVPGDPKAFPSHLGDKIPPACPGSAPGPPPSGICLDQLHWEPSRGRPYKIPGLPKLALLSEGAVQGLVKPSWESPNSLSPWSLLRIKTFATVTAFVAARSALLLPFS